MLPSKYNGRRPRGLTVWAVAAFNLALAAPARGQWALGPWDDGTVLKRGTLRVAFLPDLWHANERFGRQTSSHESLGGPFDRDSLGPAVFSMNGLAAPLQLLTGLPAPPLSAGRLRVGIEAMSWSMPITFDFGLTNRIAISVLVPYIKTRTEVFAKVNPNGPEGTIGVNPAYLFAGARSQNARVVDELSAAAAALQSQLASCLNSTAPSCAAINADRVGATALVATATQAATAVSGIYGTQSVAGSPFSPIARTSVQGAVDAKLSSLDGQFSDFLGAPGSGNWISSRPVGAPPLAAADLDRVLADSAFGIVAVPLGDVERSHLGDVEVGLKTVLLNTFGDPTGGALPQGFGARVAVAGVVRVGTGQQDSPDNFVDLGTGDGQNDVEVRGYMDVAAGRRWWTSVVARYGYQMADRVTMRIPRFAGEPFPALATKAVVDRNLGDYVELEIAPRFAPHPSFTFSGDYRYRSKQADRYSPAGGSAGLGTTVDPGTLNASTAQHDHRVGLALTYSTVRGYLDRRSPWPVDISVSHTQEIAGRGPVLKEFHTALTVRWYHSLAQRDPMRRPAR